MIDQFETHCAPNDDDAEGACADRERTATGQTPGGVHLIGAERRESPPHGDVGDDQRGAHGECPDQVDRPHVE